MVTKEKVEEMCWYVLSLIEQYKEKTDKFKETPQLDGAEYIWCKGWRAPHEPIFFEEATCGNISEPRHPIARTPRKKVHVSIHYYRDKMPIYSQIYGAEGDVICETFYTHDSGKTYGLTYDRKGELNMLSIESQNEKGLPEDYEEKEETSKSLLIWFSFAGINSFCCFFYCSISDWICNFIVSNVWL